MAQADGILERVDKYFFSMLEKEMNDAFEQGDKYRGVTGDEYLAIPPRPDVDWVAFWKLYIQYYKAVYYGDKSTLSFEEYCQQLNQTDIA